MTDEFERDQTGHDKSVETQPPVPEVPAVPLPPDVTREATGAAGAGAPAAPVAGPLTEADQKKVAEIAGSVDVTDGTSVISYGLPAQSRIATFADSLLGDVRNKDAGAGGVALNDLLKKVRELDIDALTPSGKTHIPIVGRFGNVFNRFATKYQKVAGSIDRIVDALERSRMALLKDMTVLDKMYELNLEYLKQLDVYIAAGEQVLEHLNTVRLPELEVEARTSSDPMAAQRLADFQQAVTRFERRLHDLRLTRMIAVQTAPQIRLIQGSDHDLVEKIQSSILTTVPLWKNQIVIAISLYRQQKALELQHQVSETTNELLAKNAELLRAGPGQGRPRGRARRGRRRDAAQGQLRPHRHPRRDDPHSGRGPPATPAGRRRDRPASGRAAPEADRAARPGAADLPARRAAAAQGERLARAHDDAQRRQRKVAWAVHEGATRRRGGQVVDRLRRDLLSRAQHGNAGRVGHDHLGADATDAGGQRQGLRGPKERLARAARLAREARQRRRRHVRSQVASGLRGAPDGLRGAPVARFGDRGALRAATADLRSDRLERADEAVDRRFGVAEGDVGHDVVGVGGFDGDGMLGAQQALELVARQAETRR